MLVKIVRNSHTLGLILYRFLVFSKSDCSTKVSALDPASEHTIINIRHGYESGVYLMLVKGEGVNAVKCNHKRVYVWLLVSVVSRGKTV
jgi:hypothetical protein